MSNYQELTCFTNAANHTMASVIWKIAKNKLTKYYAHEAHLGINELSL